MKEYTLEGLDQIPHREMRRFIYMAKLPHSEVIRAARVRLDRIYSVRLKRPPKPVVRVFKHGRKTLFVLRIGDRLMSAHSWENLARKVAFSPWTRIDQTKMLKSRWVGGK